MRIGHFAAVVGMRQQEKNLAVIANNLANVGTAGYKKENAHFSDYIYQTTYTSMEQGRLKTTQQPLDVALMGDGFFKIQTEEGILYTRGGNFTLNEENVLVTQEGWPVLGQGGPIEVMTSQVRIEPGGQVFDKQDGGDEYELVDVLDVVEFPDGVLLEKARNGYFKPKDENFEPMPAEAASVQQGALEDPNFSAVEEMARLIDSQRIFEAYTKILQLFDHKDSQLISKLGSP